MFEKPADQAITAPTTASLGGSQGCHPNDEQSAADGTAMPGEMLLDAGEDAVDWGNMTPSERAREAARIRWTRVRQERARQERVDAADAGDAGEVLVTQVPIRTGAIIRRLECEAVAGDIQAAKELRAWLDKYPPDDEGLDLAALERRTRDALLARLLAELGEEVPARAGIPDKDGRDVLDRLDEPGGGLGFPLPEQ